MLFVCAGLVEMFASEEMIDGRGDTADVELEVESEGILKCCRGRRGLEVVFETGASSYSSIVGTTTIMFS